MRKTRKIIEIAGDRHLETLGNCGGYYACPVSEGTGERLGPLVGYAGKYDAPDGSKKQFVGDVYANFAMAEIHMNVLKYFANCLLARLDAEVGLANIDAFISAPIGGYAFADALGLEVSGLGIQVIKAEKKVTALATSTSREKSELVFARHGIQKGFRYAWIEDVCNNFSTTGNGLSLVRAGGGEVVVIACFLNRSPTVDDEFVFPFDFTGGRAVGTPVVSVVRKVIHEWRQDDPAVADDVARGNVVWKPKDEWDRLMKAMARCS